MIEIVGKLLMYFRRTRVFLALWTNMGIACLLGLSASCWANGELDNSEPRLSVMASVRPLALIIEEWAAISGLEQQISVESFLSGNANPHHIALTASDISRVSNTDLMVWVGPELEAFLEKPIRARTKPSIKLSDLPTLQWPLSDSGSSVVHFHHGEHSHSEDVVGYRDPHLWLAYNNAISVVMEVSQHVLVLRPHFASQIEEGRATYIAKLKAQRLIALHYLSELDVRLGVAVFHDSLGHYLQQFRAEAFEIPQVAALTLVAEQQIGIRSLLQFKRQVAPACLLADIQEYHLAKGYGQKLGWPVVEIDLLAAATETPSYLEYMGALAIAISKCFGGTANDVGVEDKLLGKKNPASQ